METRTDLQGVLERINATMQDAANDARDSAQFWKGWEFARDGSPSTDDVSDDLGYWWQNPLLDASRRAFEQKERKARYHRGEFDAGGVPLDGVIWNNGPCVYRNQEIRVELRRETLGAPWTARVTISRRCEPRVVERMFFAGIPGSVAGAVGAYAQVIEKAKREIDRQSAPLT